MTHTLAFGPKALDVGPVRVKGQGPCRLELDLPNDPLELSSEALIDPDVFRREVLHMTGRRLPAPDDEQRRLFEEVMQELLDAAYDRYRNPNRGEALEQARNRRIRTLAEDLPELLASLDEEAAPARDKGDAAQTAESQDRPAVYPLQPEPGEGRWLLFRLQQLLKSARRQIRHPAGQKPWALPELSQALTLVFPKADRQRLRTLDHHRRYWLVQLSDVREALEADPTPEGGEDRE